MAPEPGGPGFRSRSLPVIEKTVFPLGLAPDKGMSTRDVSIALDGPMNYVFWTPKMRKATPALREALARDRERYVVATGPTTAWWASNLTRFVEKTRKELNVDQLDVLQMFWLGITSRWTPRTVETLVELRDSGKVRAIGVSIHDRVRAGELAADSPLDLLMVRYNAAHPGAEQDIFPHLPEERRTVVAYTATRWRRLLKAPRGWNGKVATAGDCYRFCLSHEAVDVVLCAPADASQLQANLTALEAGPMNGKEMAWMREFGSAVHG